MKKIVLGLIISAFAVNFLGCASQSVMANKDSIKVGRDDPSKDCKSLGKVTGSTLSTKATQKDVLEDMKQNAANKGATYVKVMQYSDTGTAVTGFAYQCP